MTSQTQRRHSVAVMSSSYSCSPATRSVSFSPDLGSSSASSDSTDGQPRVRRVSFDRGASRPGPSAALLPKEEKVRRHSIAQPPSLGAPPYRRGAPLETLSESSRRDSTADQNESLPVKLTTDKIINACMEDADIPFTISSLPRASVVMETVLDELRRENCDTDERCDITATGEDNDDKKMVGERKRVPVRRISRGSVGSTLKTLNSSPRRN